MVSDYEIRVNCPKCGVHRKVRGDVRDVVAALDRARDGALVCATCPGVGQGVEAWEPAWDGRYISGWHGPRGWEEDGDSDRVRTDAREYVWRWRMSLGGGVPQAFQFQSYGDGERVEVYYETEEEARADEVTWFRPDVAADDVVLEHVHRSTLEVRA